MKLYKKLFNKTCFDVAINTIVIIVTITLPIVNLGVTKPIATIWYIYQLKMIFMKSLSGHPQKCFCKTKALMKTLVERRTLVHRRIVKRIIFGKVLV
jgi:hypothetical protein